MSHGPAPEAGSGEGAGSSSAAAWVLGLGVATAAVAALISSSSTPSPLGRGSPAPAFELRRLGSDDALGLADLRGKVVLVNFWATWCKPCEDEMPAMERLYRALDGNDFELLAVSVDQEPGAVADFVSRLGLSFPVLLDPDQQVARAYQTFRFPETLLIGRDGVVVERYVGPKEWDAALYVARLRRLLGAVGASG